MAQVNKKEIKTTIKVAYGALGTIHGRYYLAFSVQGKIKECCLPSDTTKKSDLIYNWLKKFSNENNIKFIALGLAGLEQAEKIGEKIWLKLDIVPHIYSKDPISNVTELKQACYRVIKKYKHNNQALVQMAARRQIKPSFLTGLSAYKKFATVKEYSRALELADEFKKKKLKMIFINSTASGGGVAHMRHAMMRLYSLLGVNVKWHVLRPDVEIFNITKKKFHNVLQAVAPSDCVLTSADKRLYNEWISSNARFLNPMLKESNVIVIDDPQPAGLVAHIKKINPRARIIYRSHIQITADLINKKVKQQFSTWKFLWQFIKLADLFISHPIPEFVPNTVKENKLIYMPPSTDPIDGLNKKLTRRQKDYYLALFQKYLEENGQTPLDAKRPYLIQIARFDPSKGIYDVIESYRKIYRRLLKANIIPKKMPQLVIAGNGSIDDPEGVSIYEEARQILQLDTYKHIAPDIKIVRLPHYDQLLNTLMDDSLIALQLSHKEGFEFKVTEALMKGKPVIAYRSGGIPLQIRHEQTGFLVNAGETSKVADYAKKLILNKKYYNKISREASATINHDYWTLNNAAKWLFLALKIMK